MKTLTIVGCSSLLFLASFSLAQASSSLTSDTQSSCRAFVQGFYSWYVPRALKRPTLDRALKQKAALFSPELLQALREDSAASAKVSDEIVGLDFDPFLNTQDPSQRYVLGSVSAKDKRCSVEVYGVYSGKREKDASVVPELAFHGGQWVFVNFHYGKTGRPEDENLLSILKTLRADRQRPN